MTTVCPDCGAHTSNGKPGCQAIFEELIARDFSDFRYGRTHRLLVDLYAVQHHEYIASGKSFAAHLTGVCAALEYPGVDVNVAVQRWLNEPGNPPTSKSFPEKRRGDHHPYS
jgi:hypothetical protein